MKTVLVTVLITLVVLCGAVYWLLVGHGYAADEKPPQVENALADAARDLATPRRSKNLKNPVPETPGNMAEAREHFAEHCALCHGLDGKGKTMLGTDVYPSAPDLSGGDTQEMSDGELFYIISNGIRFSGMPAWKSQDSPDSIWRLVSFIRHLPKQTPQELEEMKKLQAGEPGAAEGHEHGHDHEHGAAAPEKH